jgi:hypothetical protein
MRPMKSGRFGVPVAHGKGVPIFGKLLRFRQAFSCGQAAGVMVDHTQIRINFGIDLETALQLIVGCLEQSSGPYDFGSQTPECLEQIGKSKHC